MVDGTASQSQHDQARDKSEPIAQRQGVIRTCWRWFKRVFVSLLLLLLAYAFLILIGLIPVNLDFVPDEDGVEVFVFSGEFHSDIILPIVSSEFDWRREFPASDFPTDTSEATHVAIVG